MYPTIILLTGPVEQPVLGGILREHVPQLTICPATTPAELAGVPAKVLRRARLVAFCTEVLVDARVLGALRYGAYNFHPGPPRFPGWGAAQFAVLAKASEFGATAHVMIEEVDAGAIVAVELFPVPQAATVTALEEASYLSLARMFRRLAPALVKPVPLPTLPVRWSGIKGTRARYAALCVA
jgi:hypothetical protein